MEIKRHGVKRVTRHRKVRKTLFCSMLLCLFPIILSAQATISGKVQTTDGEAVAYANVVLDDGLYFATTDEKGSFTFEAIPHAIYELRISYVGYQEVVETLNLSQVSVLDISVQLEAQSELLEQVVVTAKSPVRVLNEQPLAISSINFSSVQNSTIDAAGLLDRVNGVRVRQAGGLGSEVNISIQGAQGNAVRRYYDGLPIRFLAAGLDINNLPVNQIERVDIYRGVTPLEVGTDALGGGINIVPKKFYRNQLDASYQVGSFQTHRASVNAFLISKNDVFVGSNLFFNASENNYPTDAHDYNETTRKAENNIEVPRFHDAFRSYYADVSVGVRDRAWAEELKLTVIYNQLYDEIQTGITFNPVRPAGDAYTEQAGVTANLSYDWSSKDSRWKIQTKTNIGWYEEFIRDSTTNFYNWHGEVLQTPNNRGTDLLAAPAEITIDRTNFLQRFTAHYQFNANHQLSFSNLYIRQERAGRDAFRPLLEDPFRFPALLQQNYAGIAYDAKWLNQKLVSVLTYKNYQLAADATSLEDALNQDFERREVSNNYHGGNIALKYVVQSNWFFRASYEYAYRLPEEVELFGNQATIRSNVNLEPEQSSNYNLGTSYKFRFLKKIPVAIEVNGFYRYQKDRIILLASGFDLAQFFNEEEVEIAGVDGYLSARFFEQLTVNFSATYQDVRIRSALVEADQDLIGTRLPNVPSFFARLDATYMLDRWSVAYFYDFIEAFSSVREADAIQNVANFVPSQHAHSVELTYTFPGAHWSISARANNVFNDDVFDNFRIQRPGRNFNLKLRYTL